MIDRRIVYGIISFSFMLLFYFGITSLTSGMSNAVAQFKLYWSYIITIATGFGLQMFLYSHVRNFNISCNSQVATSGGMSAGSMVACCLHHVAEILPIVGASGLIAGSGIFLTLAYYIKPLLTVGVLSSLVGVVFMVAVIQNNGLYSGRAFDYLFKRINFEKLKYIVLVFAVTFSIYYFITYNPFV